MRGRYRLHTVLGRELVPLRVVDAWGRRVLSLVITTKLRMEAMLNGLEMAIQQQHPVVLSITHTMAASPSRTDRPDTLRSPSGDTAGKQV